MSFVNLGVKEGINFGSLENRNKKNAPFVAINISNGDHLKQSSHHQSDCPSERIEHLEPVFTGTSAEDESDQETEDAANT